MNEKSLRQYVTSWKKKFSTEPQRTLEPDLLCASELMTTDEFMLVKGCHQLVIGSDVAITQKPEILNYASIDYMALDEVGDVNNIITLDYIIIGDK